MKKISESPEYYTNGTSSKELYFQYEFQKIEDGKKRTWSWGAAFFTINWLTYRKMYAYSFITRIVVSSIYFILISLFPSALILPLPYSLILPDYYFLFAFPIFGLYGNYLYHSWLCKKCLLGVKPDQKNTSFLAVFSSVFFDLLFYSTILLFYTLLVYLLQEELSLADEEMIKELFYKDSKTIAFSLPLSIYYIVNVIRDFSFLKAARRARSKKKQMEPYRKW